MDHTNADVKKLKSLEDLAVMLTRDLLSLQTLHNFQVKAIEIGLMKEDMNERANTMAWDLRRLMNMYKKQLETTLELLPDDFNPVETLKRLMNKQKRAKKNDV